MQTVQKRKMENTQKIVMVLLILAILFSVVSIIISLSVSNISLPKANVVNRALSDSGSGEIKLIVERNSAGGVGG